VIAQRRRGRGPDSQDQQARQVHAPQARRRGVSRAFRAAQGSRRRGAEPTQRARVGQHAAML